MRRAIDGPTGMRLYHVPCGRGLWETGEGPMTYLWCDKCQEEMGYNAGGVTLGRESARRLREAQ